MSATMTPETGRTLSAVAEEGGRALKRALSGTGEERSRDLFRWLTDSHEAVPARLKTALAVEGLVWAVTALTKRVSTLESERESDRKERESERQEMVALRERVSTLESELKEHEFKGVWDPATTYQKHNTTQQGGSTWHSNINQNRSKPGEHPTAWTMQAKRGRDGRDGRDARS